jgi:hypothetical protein
LPVGAVCFVCVCVREREIEWVVIVDHVTLSRALSLLDSAALNRQTQIYIQTHAHTHIRSKRPHFRGGIGRLQHVRRDEEPDGAQGRGTKDEEVEGFDGRLCVCVGVGECVRAERAGGIVYIYVCVCVCVIFKTLPLRLRGQ